MLWLDVSDFVGFQGWLAIAAVIFSRFLFFLQNRA
jgi:hypothetical protein